MAQRVLVVDDDVGLLDLICVRLEASGYDVIKAESGEEALAVFHQYHPHLVVTDLRMGGMDGMTLFKHLQADAPLVPVIVLTAHGTIPDAVAAVQSGIFSFLTKPFDSQELLRRVADALRLAPILDPAHDAATWRRDLISANLGMEELLRQALRLAGEKTPTLILGAAGSGKRTLAEALHRASPQADGPLISLSCHDLTAAELDEAFAEANPENVFRQAANGSLYIQDIGGLPAAAQARLYAQLFARSQTLFSLQQALLKTRPDTLPHCQIMASSRRPLDAFLAEGQFRSDLYYLLSTHTLRLPGLAERPDDIPLLARHFLNEIAPGTTLSPEATQALVDAHWPGNVRQLKTVLAQAVALSHGTGIHAQTVNQILRKTDEDALDGLDDARREFEKDYLLRLLKATGGNVSQAARVAQRNRTEFYKLLGKHNLDPNHFKDKLK